MFEPEKIQSEGTSARCQNCGTSAFNMLWWGGELVETGVMKATRICFVITGSLSNFLWMHSLWPKISIAWNVLWIWKEQRVFSQKRLACYRAAHSCHDHPVYAIKRRQTLLSHNTAQVTNLPFHVLVCQCEAADKHHAWVDGSRRQGPQETEVNLNRHYLQTSDIL